MNGQISQRKLESLKQEQSFLRHLTTLNTGSILLLVTFLDKLFKYPEWQSLIGVSLISFAISICGCLIIHLLSILMIAKTTNKKSSYAGCFFEGLLVLLSFGGFFIGLVSMVIFAMKNLY